jgi:hypothetical protein
MYINELHRTHFLFWKESSDGIYIWNEMANTIEILSIEEILKGQWDN